MNKLFEAVPVSEKPEKSGWYLAIDRTEEQIRAWYDCKTDDWNQYVTHWLKPIPPPTKEAEQRAKELYPDRPDSLYADIAAKAQRAAYLKGHQEASTGQAGATVEDDWVRFPDKEPDEEGHYLCWNENTSSVPVVCNYGFIRYRESGELAVSEDGIKGCFERHGYAVIVTHWRNLPPAPGQSPTPTTDKVEEEIKRHSDTWKAVLEWIDPRTREHNPDKKTYLEQLENKLRAK